VREGVAAIPRVGGGAEGGGEAVERGVCEEGGVLRRGEQYETYRFAHLHKNTLINGSRALRMSEHCRV
jgi:hypothetical protein